MAFKTALIAADNTVSLGENNTLMDTALAMATGPFKAFGANSEKNLITEKEAGIRQIGTGVISGLLCEYWGHVRARAGKHAFIAIASA